MAPDLLLAHVAHDTLGVLVREAVVDLVRHRLAHARGLRRARNAARSD